MVNIKTGRIYDICYIDPNYPCHCPCHSDLGIMHCYPCCHDESFSGYLLCLWKSKRYENLYYFTNHFYEHLWKFDAQYVVSEVFSNKVYQKYVAEDNKCGKLLEQIKQLEGF
jgi:hypothetical protein